MATSNRDVKLTVEATAQGEEAIRRLADTVRSLGKEGKDAAPEFARLADELESLAGQSKALTSLKALTTEVEALGRAQANAAEIAVGAKADYQQQAQAADQAREALRAARVELDERRKSEATANEVLAKTKLDLRDLTAEQKRNNTELVNAKRALIEATAARQQQQVTVSEARRSLADIVPLENEASAAYTKSATALASTETALRKRNSALKDAESAARQAGVATTDLAAEEARVGGVLLEIAASAEKNRQQMVALAEATERAEQATALAGKAEQALSNIRKAAYQQDVAAKAREEAEAQQSLNEAKAQAARAEQALANIRKTAYQQDVAAKAREEAEAQKVVNAEKVQAERAEQALANIRKTAYQQDVAAKIREEAEARKAANAAASQAERIEQALSNIRKATYQQDVAAKIKAEAEAMALLAAQAKAAAEALPNAFGAVGVRSLAAIKGEITQTSQALGYLRTQYEAGAISAADLARATSAAGARIQTLRAEIAKVPEATSGLQAMNEAVLALVNRYGALTAAVATVGYAVKPIIDAAAQLDSMRRVLTQVYGSVDEANKVIAQVSKVANAAGVDVRETSDSFVKFAASAKQAGISTDVVSQVFERTVRAAGNLGLSGDQVGRVLTALSQMASKGKVSMEELSQQLGDSLPGALALMAKGLGITQPELVKLVESGKLLAEQALPALASALVELGGKGDRVEGLSQSFARLRNAVTETYRQFNETTAYKVLTAAVDGLATNFSAAAKVAVVLVEALAVRKIVDVVDKFITLRTATTAVTVATEAATVATVANTGAQVANTAATVASTAARGANAKAWGEMAAVLGAVGPRAAEATAQVGLLARAKDLASGAAGRLTSALGGLPALIALVVLNGKDLLELLGETAAHMTGVRDRSTEVGKALAAAEAAVRKTADAQKELNGSLVRAEVAYTKALEPINAAITASEKRAKATKDEGDQLATIAALTGDQAKALAAQTQAAQGNVVAQSAVVEARQYEEAALRQLLAQYAAKEKAMGSLTDAEAKQRDENVRKLEVVQAEVEQARQKLAVDGAAVSQAKVNAAAYRDNALELDRLRDSYDKAALTVDTLRKLQGQGLATQQQVATAARESAEAEALYRDALADTAKRMEYVNNLRAGTAKLEIEGIRVKKEEAAAREVHARILGDETGELRAQIDQRKADIQIAERENTLQREQAEACIASIREQRNELASRGLLDDKTRESLELQQLDTEALLKNTQARTASIKAMKEEVRAREEVAYKKLLQSDPGRAVGGDGIVGVGKSGETLADRNARITAESDQATADRKAQNGQAIDNTYQFQLRDRLRAGGSFTADELPAIQNAYRVAQENALLAARSSVPDAAGTVDAVGWAETMRQVLEKAQGDAEAAANSPRAARIVELQRMRAAGGDAAAIDAEMLALRTGRTYTPAAAAAAASQAVSAAASTSTGGTRTVNINLAGLGSTAVNVASDADAARLEALLRQLEQAAGRAGG